jgi:hypothetical protein
VASWEGKTSTPADDETRTLRSKCHVKFDPLWKRVDGKRTRRNKFVTRTDAYQWMQSVMGISKDKCHIGMLDKEQCERLLKILELI